jgi:23S rRNA (guanine745-N1)-methyltransferase
MGAAVCDAWSPLPLRAGAAALVLSVFSPRNGPQMRRALGEGGEALVVAPGERHLGELAEPLGLIGVDDEKERRVDDAMSPLRRGRTEELEFTMELGPEDVAALVAMGPSARHLEAGPLADSISALPEPVAVTASVTLASFAPAPAAA